MLTTLNVTPPPFIGVDPTDRHARSPRPMDACGLTPLPGGRFATTFWQWQWPAHGERLDVSPLLRELNGWRITAIDGPQGLARPGARMRECERRLAAAGKTPDVPPEQGPFAGFVRSSVELFAALHAARVPVSAEGASRGVYEVYPGRLWPELAGIRLPNKGSAEGRATRGSLLAALGVVFDESVALTHDQLDACVAAVVAAALGGAIAGLEVRRAGLPLGVDTANLLREGPILHLEVTGAALRHSIDAALARLPG